MNDTKLHTVIQLLAAKTVQNSTSNKCSKKEKQQKLEYNVSFQLIALKNHYYYYCIRLTAFLSGRPG